MSVTNKMQNCCQDVPKLACSTENIMKRIEPIDYINGILTVNSPLNVSDSLSIGGAQMSVLKDHINLPARTLINGVPLLSDAFLDDVISLPTSTKIDGYFPITEQYYYFYTATDGTLVYTGYIVNGLETPVSTRTAAQDPRAYSFVAPEDCVLSSLKFLYTFQAGSYTGTSPIASVLIDVVDTNLVVYYTGFYMDVPAPSSNTIGRVFVEQDFEYFVRKGDSVGVWVQDNVLVSGSIAPYAVLGYKILPPQTLLSSPSMFQGLKQMLPTSYNRFPFNNIMNSMANRPTNINDQIAFLRSAKTSSEIYGRSMTTYDFEARLNMNRSSVDHAGIALFFSKNKPDGWYIDLSSSFNNTEKMETQYNWKGILMGPTEPTDQRSSSFYVNENFLSPDIITQCNLSSSIVDYLSIDIDDPTHVFEIIEKFTPVLDQYKFSFVTVRHDFNQDIQSKAAYLLFSYGYTRIFTNVIIRYNGTCEDWYAHPHVLDSSLLERISEHYRNHFNIQFQECVDIIKDANSNI